MFCSFSFSFLFQYFPPEVRRTLLTVWYLVTSFSIFFFSSCAVSPAVNSPERRGECCWCLWHRLFRRRRRQGNQGASRTHSEPDIDHFYYVHTETQKSHKTRTQMSCSQWEAANDAFHAWNKSFVQSQAVNDDFPLLWNRMTSVFVCIYRKHHGKWFCTVFIHSLCTDSVRPLARKASLVRLMMLHNSWRARFMK